jgi:MinD superfamily P-loop ATPase
MIIAVASGKGGTGKTTLSAAMAFAAPGPVRLLDCDVEEPNSHFFIQPEITRTEPVHRLVPQIDAARCTGCGKCAQLCQFNAIAAVGRPPLIFADLCHSCGGCARICPTGAITEIPREIGILEIGRHGTVEFVSGRMNVGQAMSPPIIRAVKEHVAEEGLTLIDCPPGTACPFVTAVKGCEAALLVTEPTPFGLHDLKLAVETLRELKIPFGVVVNRILDEDSRISEYCLTEGLPLLLQIPDDRRIAEAYSRGQILTTVMPELQAQLATLPEQLGALS